MTHCGASCLATGVEALGAGTGVHLCCACHCPVRKTLSLNTSVLAAHLSFWSKLIVPQEGNLDWTGSRVPTLVQMLVSKWRSCGFICLSHCPAGVSVCRWFLYVIHGCHPQTGEIQQVLTHYGQSCVDSVQVESRV